MLRGFIQTVVLLVCVRTERHISPILIRAEVLTRFLVRFLWPALRDDVQAERLFLQQRPSFFQTRDNLVMACRQRRLLLSVPSGF